MKKSEKKEYHTYGKEERIAELIAIETERGFLLDEEIQEYFTLRYPNSKTKWHRYWR